jgi:hypothetical protein
MAQGENEEFLERLKIGNRAVKKAQENNWKKGLPNVYSKNKKLFFEFPNETDKVDPSKKG